MKILLVAAFVFVALAPAASQDAVATLPNVYSLQFENAWVKIVRVRYPPLAKLPAHAHPSRATAYVYLSDAGPVIFRHAGEKGFTATRPAAKAGTFRVFRGREEMHEVENTTDLASEFLRVEFKTEPKGESTLRGRYHREPVPAGENLEKVQFENEQVRVTRLVCAPGKSLTLATSATEPALLIDLSVTPGAHRWLAAGRTEAVDNPRSVAHEWLRFDFKTSPESGSRTGPDPRP
jgi:hypothetical protein